jgi:hypothetical protein
MESRERQHKLIGGVAALIAAAFLTVFAATEAALGPAQDLSNGGAGDPGRIALSISLILGAFAAIAVCLLMLRTRLRRTGDTAWPSAALALAAMLFTLSVALLFIGQLADWWPGELLGIVNLPGLVLLVLGWFVVGRSSLTTAGAMRLGILVVTQAALAAALFALSAVGGSIVPLIEAAFIVGWILVAAWIWSASATLGSAASTT